MSLVAMTLPSMVTEVVDLRLLLTLNTILSDTCGRRRGLDGCDHGVAAGAVAAGPDALAAVVLLGKT